MYVFLKISRVIGNICFFVFFVGLIVLMFILLCIDIFCVFIKLKDNEMGVEGYEILM